MNHRSLRRAIAASLVAAALATPLSSLAQQAQDTAVSDLVVVAPASGPAWWKVSKGDASVWILGLQPMTPTGMTWDQSTLQRRLKGARLMLGLYNEGAQFDRYAKHPTLPSDLAEEVATLTTELGGRRRRNPSEGRGANRPPIAILRGPPDRNATTTFSQGSYRPKPRPPRQSVSLNVIDLMALRNMYAYKHKLGFNLMPEIDAVARRTKVPVVTPPVSEFTWTPAALAPDNPIANRCLRAVIAVVKTPPERHREAAALWAKGDVRGMLEATPPSDEVECGYLWPGLRERTIAFQTSLIAQALDRPGKVVAVALTSHLVAKDGILERLRAQGFTIADPSKPLEE